MSLQLSTDAWTVYMYSLYNTGACSTAKHLRTLLNNVLPIMTPCVQWLGNSTGFTTDGSGQRLCLCKDHML
jgi:hypothetical protein